jgi:hypothetical protein
LQSINDLSSDESNTTVWMIPMEVLEAIKWLASKWADKSTVSHPVVHRAAKKAVSSDVVTDENVWDETMKVITHIPKYKSSKEKPL